MTYPMQMLGRLDGENAIKTGEGFYFKAMDEWRDSPELQKDFPHIGHYINHHIQLEKRRHAWERRHEIDIPVKTIEEPVFT